MAFDDVADLGRDTKVYKEECMYCFNNGETKGGILVCLKTFYGLCPRHVILHNGKTGSKVYARRVTTRKLNPDYEKKMEQQSNGEITKLGIGIDGGISLDVKKYDLEDKWTIAVYPQLKDMPLHDQTVPAHVREICNRVMAAESAYRLQELENLAGAWDGSSLPQTKHVDIPQLPNPPKIPSSGWKCEAGDCDLTTNLWLNLSSGKVLCGRQYADGSGGNHHGALYYEQNKNYPLAVKLGTIAGGKADVFSYAEDDLVLDPKLADHLKHFGIDVMGMEKTEKTMLELELDMNQKFEWSAITEEGSKLENVYGKGYTGIANLGSSCYINASIQTLMLVKDFVEHFVDKAESVFLNEKECPADSIWSGTAKLMSSLASGNYSIDPKKSPLAAAAFECGVRPVAFRNRIGKNHPEFSTRKQQDAEEFLRHFFQKLEENAPGEKDPLMGLRFEAEERRECPQTRRVAYTRVPETILTLPIPMDAVLNAEEVRISKEVLEAAQESGATKRAKLEDPVLPKIPLLSCFESWHGPSTVVVKDATLDANVDGMMTNQLGTFPDFLLVQLQKYTFAEEKGGLVPKKLDVDIQIPPDDIIDLSHLRAKGRQPGEEDWDIDTKKKKIDIDDAVVAQLMVMGYGEAACRKAVYVSGNSGVETAMEWVLGHMTDDDFNMPHPDLVAGPPPDLVIQLVSMGMTDREAKAGLQATNNDVEAAVGWIFENRDNLPQGEPEAMDTDTSTSSAKPKVKDSAVGKYKLVGFISHMGSSPACGHYVCHLLKDGRWVIYNDEKVAYSNSPPKGLGYIYLFKRLDVN